MKNIKLTYKNLGFNENLKTTPTFSIVLQDSVDFVHIIQSLKNKCYDWMQKAYWEHKYFSSIKS